MFKMWVLVPSLESLRHVIGGQRKWGWAGTEQRAEVMLVLRGGLALARASSTKAGYKEVGKRQEVGSGCM